MDPWRYSLPMMLCCLASAAWGCTDWEVQWANKLLDNEATSLLNELLKTHTSKTVGDCSEAANEELQACKSIKTFPVKKSGTDYELEVPYVTHLDTCNLTKVYLRCDDDPANLSPQKYFFADIRGNLGELAVALQVHVSTPPLTINAPCYGDERCFFDEHNVGFNVAARVVCHNATSFGLELDGKQGLTFDRPIVVTVSKHLPSIDITEEVRSNAQKSLAKSTAACTSKLAWLCKLICRSDADETHALVV